MTMQVSIQNPNLSGADRLYAYIQNGITELKKHLKDRYNPEENGLLIYVPVSKSHYLQEPISYLVDHLPVIDQLRGIYPSTIVTSIPLSFTVRGKTREGDDVSLDVDKIVCMSRLPSKHSFSYDEFVEIEIVEGN